MESSLNNSHQPICFLHSSQSPPSYRLCKFDNSEKAPFNLPKGTKTYLIKHSTSIYWASIMCQALY